MINRSYLPFQSARDYQDTKMQKWMGFFLSEHTSALDEESKKVTITPNLGFNKKLLLLSQAYRQQLTIQVSLLEKNSLVSYIGTIPTLSKNKVLIKSKAGHTYLRISDIINLTLVEDIEYESA